VFSPLLERNLQVVPDDEKLLILKIIGDKGIAKELMHASKDDTDLTVPMPILEAEKGCGSITSLVANARGHLWSAKHGLLNHLVGDQCIEMDNAQGVYNFALDRTADTHAMGIIIAYLVENSFIRRPNRPSSSHPYMDRATCAEHPINIIEPVLGFSEDEKFELIQTLSTWNVPFVGFVNGAVAALMCGADPKRNGIVVAIGGMNSGIAIVKDGLFVRGNPLENYNRRMHNVLHGARDNTRNEDCKEMDRTIAREVSIAIEEMLRKVNDGGEGIEVPPFVLLTGGGATDSIVRLIKNNITATNNVNVGIASPQKERHLDTVRGGHVLANLSDNQKHFIGVMNYMWTMQVA